MTDARLLTKLQATFKLIWQYIKRLDSHYFATRKLVLWRHTETRQYHLYPWMQRLVAVTVISLTAGLINFIIDGIQARNSANHSRLQLISYLAPTTDLPSPARLNTDIEQVVRQVGEQISQYRQQSQRFNDLMLNAISSMAHITIPSADQTSQVNDSANAAYMQLTQLINQVVTTQARQADALAYFNQWTAGALVHNQSVLALTGIELEQLIAADSSTSSVGGPSNPEQLPSSTTGAKSLHHNLASLEDALVRLHQYQAAFECLPLNTPVEHYRLSSGFGMRKDPFTHQQAMHNGLDMAAMRGTTVRAPAAGTVARIFNNGGYGQFLEVRHGCGLVTRYGHLQKVLVKEGQTITFNQTIATIGSSGRSTGPHLHYEILWQQQPQDPSRFLKAGRYVFKKNQNL